MTIPSSCPGTQSENAGKSASCQGCPNQAVCSSGAANLPDPDLDLIRDRMKSVGRKIIVLSGKGGVGKSSVTSQLAFSLALLHPELQIGVMDIDVCGPSIPRMMGVEREQIHHSNSGWTPVYALDNLCVISVGFLLQSTDDAVIWRGPKKNGMIKQFLKDVDWGDLDILLIDTPPGTSDEHLSIVKLLAPPSEEDGDSNSTCAIIVTTPQEISLVDVKKEIDFCRKVKLPILGVVENMRTFVCPNCHKSSDIFAPSRAGGGAVQLGLPILSSIPLDPLLARSCDFGLAYIQEYPESACAKQYIELCGEIEKRTLL